MSGVYWGLTALDLMDSRDTLNREDVIDFVLQCQHSNGGFGAHPDHDPHLLYTLSAIQILLIEDGLDRVDKDKIAKCECLIYVFLNNEKV
jgi:geranylgeranyl transferase type-2 subunit beta